jgi:hypothetical protein
MHKTINIGYKICSIISKQPGTEEAKAKEEEPDRASKYNLQGVNLKELTKGDKPVRKKKRPDSMKSKDADHDHKKGEENDEEEEGLTVCCIRYIEVARDREGGSSLPPLYPNLYISNTTYYYSFLFLTPSLSQPQSI